MEILFILLICTWAIFFLVRHVTRRFERSASCCQGCKNCSGATKSCDQKEENK